MAIATEQPTLSQGAPLSEVPAQPALVTTERRTSRKATWALVCGIIGMLVLAILFSTVAITLGVVAKNEIDRDPELEGGGRAVAGIVLGVIGLVFFAVFVAAQVATS